MKKNLRQVVFLQKSVKSMSDFFSVVYPPVSCVPQIISSLKILVLEFFVYASFSSRLLIV